MAAAVAWRGSRARGRPIPSGAIRMSEPERSEPTEAGRVEEQDVLDVLPSIAKLAATLWIRATVRGVEGSVEVGGRLARAATNPGEAIDIVAEVSDGLRNYARGFLGIAELDARVRVLAPPGTGP